MVTGDWGPGTGCERVWECFLVRVAERLAYVEMPLL